MKEKIIYIVSFLFAFVLVTGLLIYLNSSYKNIFTFDFTPASQTNIAENKTTQQIQTPTKQKDTTALPAATLPDSMNHNLHTAKIDSASLSVKDSIALNKPGKKIAEEKKEEPLNTSVVQNAPIKPELFEKNAAKRDSVYKLWVKSTVKLYESMDAKKAAKIILGYSDNIARDILLTMKKKRAADILAEFKPEVAARIISVVQ
ncbi:MAG: hypothetical protein AB1298_01455 [Bacteroidota bacterium]